ncbi:MAG: peptide deformylase [Planctomycetia bacterium]|nr:peptide deformylase [Planctomycetia bacterium]
MRIVKYPHPILRYKCKPLRKIDQTIRDIVQEMFDLMYETQGVGLAANQVDLPYQLIVINPTGDAQQKDKEVVLINPIILKLRGNEEGEEGCLSFPDMRLIVPRARECKFQAIDLKGQVVNYHWKGFDARIVQHETDHLSGVSFFQHAVASNGDLETQLLKLQVKFKEDLKNGLEPTEEQFLESVKKWEEERA